MVTFVMRPESVFLSRVDSFLERIRQSGILQKHSEWAATFFTRDIVVEARPIEMIPNVIFTDFLDITYLYIGALVLICGVFLLEVIYFKRRLIWRSVRNLIRGIKITRP